jgi:hypothetical protein
MREPGDRCGVLAITIARGLAGLALTLAGAGVLVSTTRWQPR